MSRNAVIGLLSFLTLIDLFGAQAILPTLTAAYGVDPSTMGVAVNASTFGMAVAGLAVAFFSRHIDRQRGIWLSLALLSVPTFLLGVVDGIAAFTALRVAQGVLMSTAFTLTMAYLAEESSAGEAAGAMAAYITGNVVSNLLGRLMAANFTAWVGLSGSFWAFAALNLLGAFLASRCLAQSSPRERVADGPSPLDVWKLHLSNPPLRAGFGIGFLILFIFLGVFTYINFILSEPPFGLSKTELGLVYFVFLPAVFTTPMAGHLVKIGGVRKAFAIAMTVAVAGAVALLSSNLWLVLVGLVAVGVGTFCAQAIVSGFIGRAAATDRAAASGLYLASYYLGGLCGAFLLGQAFASFGWTVTVAVVLAAGIFSIWLALRLEPAPVGR